MNTRTRALIFTTIAMALYVDPSAAFASSAGMPWEQPLETILNSVTGPVARAIGGIIIVMCGMALTAGEGSGGTRRLLWVGMGLSITFSAVSFFLSFLGFAQGAAA